MINFGAAPLGVLELILTVLTAQLLEKKEGGTLFYNPLVYVSGLGREVHTYAVDFAAVLRERKGVLPVLNLLHGPSLNSMTYT